MSIAWHEIRDHLMHSSSTLKFQRSFDTLRRESPTVAPFPDPAALLDRLHDSAGDPDQKNLVLSAMVDAAQGDASGSDCALTVLLLALWPGLDAIRRRSIWRRIGPDDEIAADVLARATEAIRGLDLSRVHRIAATVLRNIERDMIRVRKREAGRERAAIDVDPDDMPADQAREYSAPQDAQLRSDLHKLIGTEAALVIRVAIEGFTQAEIAIELGLSAAATRKRYQRATTRLRGALQELSDPMSQSGQRGGFSHSDAIARPTRTASRHL